QEEAICHPSNLYFALKKECCPWPNLGQGSDMGVYSPAVVIFKDDLDHSCVDLLAEQGETIAVLAVTAPRLPEVSGRRSG
ncbi:hypothetical protein BDM02DRAFT_3102057, partial [Thelephora ganbajun]